MQKYNTLLLCSAVIALLPINVSAKDEDHAHGVRNLVTNPDLLSEID